MCWVACTAASNAIGTMPDLSRVVELAHGLGALFNVDGMQSVPQVLTSVVALGVDGLA